MSDPYEFLVNVSEDTKRVKVTENQKNVFADVVSYDVQLEAASNKDQQTRLQEYLDSKDLLSTVRQGSTVIQLFNQDGQVQSTVWGRQGMKKFFTLTKDLTDPKAKSSPTQQQIHTEVLNELQDSFNQGYKIRLFSVEKLDGENAQITWSSHTKSWLISNESASIFARIREDIREYTNPRYYVVTRIAEAWFDQLEDLESLKIDVQNLKHDLTGRNLIGEFVGSLRFQKLVRYNSPTLIFYNIVNLGEEHYPSQDEVHQFLDHYGLNTAITYNLGVYNDLNSLLNVVQHRIEFTARQDVESYGQGTILYFQRENQQSKGVFLTAQLNTIEYQIFILLQAKLREYLNDTKIDKKDILKSFRKEGQELCSGFKPARQFNFYYKLAQGALDFVSSYEKKADRLLDSYADFLDVLFDAYDTNKQMDPSMFNDKNLKRLAARKLSSVAPELYNPKLSQLPQKQKAK